MRSMQCKYTSFVPCIVRAHFPNARIKARNSGRASPLRLGESHGHLRRTIQANTIPGDPLAQGTRVLRVRTRKVAQRVRFDCKLPQSLSNWPSGLVLGKL
eukprot:2891301-Rhodomonas_salina.2